jgi:hypothetical protein
MFQVKWLLLNMTQSNARIALINYQDGKTLYFTSTRFKVGETV